VPTQICETLSLESRFFLGRVLERELRFAGTRSEMERYWLEIRQLVHGNSRISQQIWAWRYTQNGKLSLNMGESYLLAVRAARNPGGDWILSWMDTFAVSDKEKESRILELQHLIAQCPRVASSPEP
jgi:hypothetical protein